MKIRPLHTAIIVVASLLTCGSYLINNSADRGRFGWMARALDTLQLPAVFIGILVSNNIHQPNEAVTYVALLLTFALLVGLLAWLLKKSLERFGYARRRP